MGFHRHFSFFIHTPTTQVTWIWTPIIYGPAYVTNFSFSGQFGIFGLPPDQNVEFGVSSPGLDATGTLTVPITDPRGFRNRLGWTQFFHDLKSLNHPDGDNEQQGGYRLLASLRFVKNVKIKTLVMLPQFHLIVGERNRNTINNFTDGYFKVIELLDRQEVEALSGGHIIRGD